RTSARRGATGLGPACSAGTPHTLRRPYPGFSPRLSHTPRLAPARAPVVASRHRSGPQTGGLVATGRRRWRLPAGVGSPHGRTGGGLAWRGSSLGWEKWTGCKMQRVMYHAVRLISWGLCWSSSLFHMILQHEVSTHSRDSAQFPYFFGI